METLLIARCERKRHVIFTVGRVDGQLHLFAPRIAVGRERETWTAGSRPLNSSRITRYGCACGRTTLISDVLVLEKIRRGETRMVIAGTNISSRRRSGMGKHVSE
jgi:hypothetical protein